jgi:ribonuclease Y
MLVSMWISAVMAVALGGIVAWLAGRAAARKAEGARHALASETEALKATARAEAAVLVAKSESAAREAALATRRAQHEEAVAAAKKIDAREEALRGRDSTFRGREQALIARQSALTTREEALRGFEKRRKEVDDEMRNVADDAARTLERLAGDTRTELQHRLINDWIEEARASAAESLRRIDQGLNDVEHARQAKRVMGIAIQRYAGHYLTERLLSNLPLLTEKHDRFAPPKPLEELRAQGEAQARKIFGASLENIPIIEEIANIKLQLAEDFSGVRLDGQDSFGREIARRVVSRFGKHGPKGEVRKAVENIKEELEREVFDLGKRAFKELEIPRSHPDIVRLVGRLNWRTSYTQNQWKHAVEAAFLCGMMAEEMGLDVKLARRAGLMHDIGKSLTHAIDGSHAVIGADYARRLGESELIANAIGAHHADEPCNSVYASLVAAADAMSGARPGARREQSDNYVQKLEDLERIGGRFPGVERAFAVQGGREVRVYVHENRVSDERAVELSAQIAAQISDELTFPGQIKVTVIREMRAEAVAN